MTEQIKKLIEEYEEPGDFTYPNASKELLDDAATTLKTSIPEQYVDFLCRYGHGGIGGIEIIGIGKSGTPLFVSETMKYRELGLPENMIVTENCDEWIYCINGKNGKIFSWSNESMEEAYPDFDTYLLDRYGDAAENI